MIPFSDEMIAAINKCKGLLLEKADRNSNRSQQEITEELDMVVESALSKYIHYFSKIKKSHVRSFIKVKE